MVINKWNTRYCLECEKKGVKTPCYGHICRACYDKGRGNCPSRRRSHGRKKDKERKPT